MNDERAIQVVNAYLENNFDWEESELIEVLKYHDDAYFNDNQLIEDSVYDTFRKMVKQTYASNKYFTGVGSAVRGGKVDLPHRMPSLDQIEIGQIKQWIDKTELNFEDIVISDKMDGASLMIIYDENGDLQIAFSRGDGIQGADVTRHVRKMKNVPQKVQGRLDVRLEVELSETNFQFLQTKVKSRSGEPYRNARNMVSGVMNASSNPAIIYDYLNVFGYSILGAGSMSKVEQLETLNNLGFDVPYYIIKKGIELNDEFLASYLSTRRTSIDFAIDGVVMDVNNSMRRHRLDSMVDGGNPKSAVKYKVADATNQHIATVLRVDWNVSKHGYLKPTIVFEPFPLCGVTVQHATGFNAKFIVDNKIGPGAKVLVVRSGDVIPYAQEVIEGTFADIPTEKCEWNETRVDLVLTNKNDNDEVKIQQLVDFCASLSFPHLGDGNVRALYEHGIKTPQDIVLASMSTFALAMGVNGIKAYHGIQAKLKEVSLSDVMGAHPAFGRGIGQRKMKKLVEALGEDFRNWTHIADVEGFDVKTASLVAEGIDDFNVFYEATKEAITYKSKTAVEGGKLVGHKIVMTGFRDKVLEQMVETLGGENQSGVSAKTTIVVAADPDSTSGKASKARELNNAGKANIQIMSIKQFKDFIS